MTGPAAPILFVGALTLDTLYTAPGFAAGPGKYLSTSRVSTASGMAANAATASVRLGGRAALWASAGAGSLGDGIIAEIEAEGVDCDHVRRVTGGRTASATVIVDETGERWVVVDYDPVTQAPPDPGTWPPVDRYAAVMADVRWPGAARPALLAARAAGRPAILDADVATADVLQDLAPCATHIVASAPGMAILAGTSDIRAAADKISRSYGCFTCITDGAAGSVWAAPGSAGVHHTANPQIDAVDTNGAGDVFHGAFALALAEGRTEPRAIRFASAAAALKCMVVGGRLGAPNRAETLTLMNETYP